MFINMSLVHFVTRQTDAWSILDRSCLVNHCCLFLVAVSHATITIIKSMLSASLNKYLVLIQNS